MKRRQAGLPSTDTPSADCYTMKRRQAGLPSTDTPSTDSVVL